MRIIFFLTLLLFISCEQKEAENLETLEIGLKTEEEFRDFLGTINNFEEALLLARTYGYRLDDDIRGSEYRNLQNGYELHLMKYHEFPIRKKSVEIKISKNGFIKTKSRGIYCEGTDCL